MANDELARVMVLGLIAIAGQWQHLSIWCWPNVKNLFIETL